MTHETRRAPEIESDIRKILLFETLIQAAAGGRLDAEAIQQAAQAEAVSIVDLCDLFAAAVAHRFLDGHMTYEAGDTAMNALFGVAYQEGGPGFHQIAWKVFVAFDEGEYLRPDNAEMQGEIRTR